MYSKKAQRRAKLMVEAWMGVTAISTTLWLVWYEFKKVVFEEPLFLTLILMWALSAYILFLGKLTENGKTSDEKIDELIQEIRVDREQRAKEVENGK